MKPLKSKNQLKNSDRSFAVERASRRSAIKAELILTRFLDLRDTQLFFLTKHKNHKIQTGEVYLSHLIKHKKLKCLNKRKTEQLYSSGLKFKGFNLNQNHILSLRDPLFFQAGRPGLLVICHPGRNHSKTKGLSKIGYVDIKRKHENSNMISRVFKFHSEES